jgi:hypothetical protein
MATSPKNRITRSVSPKSVYESAINVIDATVSFNQGDILCLDSDKLKAVAADADGATVLGVAQATVLLGKVVGPYSGLATSSAQAIEDIAGPVYGVIVRMKLKSGDVFGPSDAVYACAVDAQTVSSAGTNQIGIFQGASITAGASSEGEILIGAVTPAGLQF